ncbi:MAG: D-tyrosyl-tRNA(Tyr) deacylase [Sinobacterium sp.]|nr:D-tyrosyl-tRNA(Tyr) deacylase [Sinobacterium sp.]
MKALIQRVSQASVTIDQNTVGEISSGLLILLGIGHEDTEAKACQLLQKILHYRLFSDADDKMNLDVQQIHGQLLIVSQFTLMADTAKGRRPSFTTAAKPDKAEHLYNYFIEQAQQSYKAENIQTGKFGADMKVALLNDGPVTFMLEV